MLSKIIKENVTSVVVTATTTTQGGGDTVAGAAGGDSTSKEALQIKISIDDPIQANQTIERVAGKIVSVMSAPKTARTQEEMELNLIAVALVLLGISLFFHLLTRLAEQRRWRERTLVLCGVVRVELTRYMGELAALVFFVFATSISISELNKYVVSYWQGGFRRLWA